MRGGLCGKLHGRPSQLLIALQQSSIRQPYIRRESRFYPTTPAFDAPHQEGGVLVGILSRFGTEKTRMVWLPKVKKMKIRLHERDGHTDGRTDTAQRHRPRLCIASRGKNRNFRPISRFIQEMILDRARVATMERQDKTRIRSTEWCYFK